MIKKTILLLLSCVLCGALAACASPGSYELEAKTPPDPSALTGKHYEDVVSVFADRGFTNIQTEPIEAPTTDGLTEDGTVAAVTAGGADCPPGQWLPAHTEIRIQYYTLPQQESELPEPSPTPDPSAAPAEGEVLTAQNSPELASVLSAANRFDPVIKAFAGAHRGRTVEFDGSIVGMVPHGDDITRYDVFITAGTYGETSVIGPYFQFPDVNMTALLDVSPEMGIGSNIHIIARVVAYHEDSGLLELAPVFVSTMGSIPTGPAAEPSAEPTPEPEGPGGDITYVLNVKSKKFHLPTCSGLPTKNRQDTTLSRDALIAQGYDPCGICHP